MSLVSVSLTLLQISAIERQRDIAVQAMKEHIEKFNSKANKMCADLQLGQTSAYKMAGAVSRSLNAALDSQTIERYHDLEKPMEDMINKEPYKLEIPAMSLRKVGKYNSECVRRRQDKYKCCSLILFLSCSPVSSLYMWMCKFCSLCC